MQQRIVWEDLPEDTRTAIQARTGPIEQACAVSEGTNSTLAAVLHSRAGRVFVKGIRTDHPSVVTQQREAAIKGARAHGDARAAVAPRRRRVERPWLRAH
ncbi:MAG: hypothetical protein JO281_17990 [Pseudonocardiales bacterium]|nr:hypothetical protein [Pseudonocardiales bacterium]